MTTYAEMCQAYFDWQPHAIAIDGILRELPLKIRQSIADHLQAPKGMAYLPSVAIRPGTGYVDLYETVADTRGAKTWRRCEADNYLQLRADGIYHFTIGICLEKQPGSINATMVFCTFSIESFDEHSAVLKIENLAGEIALQRFDDASFGSATTVICERLMNFLREAPPTRQRPIGFFVGSNSLS